VRKLPERIKLVQAEDGASLVEYGLLLALITIVCLAAIGSIGSQIVSFFTSFSNSL
jgi:pilus assembly protein Flp/PilA